VDTSTMISELASTGHVTLSIAQVGDLCDIDSRIKNGDESGWRGDPTMGIFVNALTGMFEVWGIDRRGNQYCAATHHRLDHTLLIKLREGDPRTNDVWQNVLEHNAKVKADLKAKDDENFAVIADKMQHAIRREFHGRRNPITVERKMEG